MRIDILTLFPSMFSPLSVSILGRARVNKLLNIKITNIRDFARDKHKTVDDTPYGGGAGMVIKSDLVFEALSTIKGKKRVILMTPTGKKLDDTLVKELSKEKHLVIICGHYEGIDERISSVVDDEISIGDYVLTGGEIPAMTLIDSIARFIPGILGHTASSKDESFSVGLLEYPQYTRPEELKKMTVPDVLLSGHHEKIVKWRKSQSVVRTFIKRPDMLVNAVINRTEREALEALFTGNSV